MKDTYEYQRVWDSTTRIWHWLLAISVISGWLLGEFRSFSVMQWHFYCGYLTGVLLLFRLVWGTVGPKRVRLSQLIDRPSAIWRYTKTLIHREPSGIAGHSPLGSVATIIILLLLMFQVISGSMSEDDGLFYEGPMAQYVSSEITLEATAFHSRLSDVILFVLVLHLGVMVYYYVWKKENLALSMVTGKKKVKRP